MGVISHKKEKRGIASRCRAFFSKDGFSTSESYGNAGFGAQTDERLTCCIERKD